MGVSSAFFVLLLQVIVLNVDVLERPLEPKGWGGFWILKGFCKHKKQWAKTLRTPKNLDYKGFQHEAHEFHFRSKLIRSGCRSLWILLSHRYFATFYSTSSKLTSKTIPSCYVASRIGFFKCTIALSVRGLIIVSRQFTRFLYIKVQGNFYLICIWMLGGEKNIHVGTNQVRFLT